ncbi:MAG: apolipoprotein N-acyltransferase [Deltaproteobacteria bacterium]|nr:MAG: apolipoprotein N-acyltransferase [Deltaproteobacteria bacterium]
MKTSFSLIFLCSACSALLVFAGMPGSWSFPPLLFVGLVPLIHAFATAENGRQAAWAGGVFGLIYHLLILYWIVVVLGKYGGLPLWVSIPALTGLAGYMTLYCILFSVTGYFITRKYRPGRWIFLLPALWVAGDWLRSVLLTGFPWLDLGYGLWENVFLIQSAELFGHHGISFLLVMSNVLIALFLARKFSNILQAAWLIIILLMPVYSFFSLALDKKELAEAEIIETGIVQGNILQNEKWQDGQLTAAVKKYLALSRGIDGSQQLDLLVWPETAIPFYPNITGEFRLVSRFLRENQGSLLTGAPWFEVEDEENRIINYYNSALLLDPASRLIGKYYKSHLVPYGEYVPLKKYTPFLAPLVESVGDFTPGIIEKPLALGKARIGILICYESIFPEIARKWSQNGANLLVNLTNDAWYGKSSAPYQSFAMSVFRAVENGRSLIRSANTGISGFIEPNGRVCKASPIFASWAESGKVVLQEGRTIYTLWGFYFAPACLIFVCFAVVFAVIFNFLPLAVKRKIINWAARP